MNRRQWKNRQNFYIFFGIVVFYLLVRAKNFNHEMKVFLPEIQPKEPWNFIADFSNMKYLNPTIVDFTIEEESGNYDHWKYTVNYKETLSHWPFLSNYNVGYFNVKTTPSRDQFLIFSTHKTCMLLGFYCLYSESEFKFSKNNHTSGTICDESITYQCPAILSTFCKREVQFQRNSIMNNLKKKFLK